jgi:zinc protease
MTFARVLIFAVGFSFAAQAATPTVLVETDPSLLVSYVSVVVQTGAKSDPREKVGLTTFMAELMLRGNKKKTRTAFQSELERMGAALAVHTSHDMIFFDGRVIAENTVPFLKMLQEAILNPTFSPKEIENLRTETLAEIAHIKNNNNRLPGLAMRREVFAGTPLERPVAGSLSTVKAIKREDIVRRYNDSFHQGNIVFGLATPVKEATWKKEIDYIWEKLPDGARKKEVSIAPKIPAKPTLIVINKPKTATGVLMFAQAGITAKDDYRYTLNTGNFSFGGEPLVSRLFRIVRGELGYTYAVWSTYQAMGGLSRQQGVFTIAATPAVEFTSKTLLKILEMWKSYLSDGLESSEVRLAHESLVNSYPFEFDSASKRLGQKLESYLQDIPILSTDEFSKKINGIDNGDIKKALKERQTADGWIILLVADESVVRTQLAEAQKDIAEKDRITIAKVVTPDELVQ